ncbi:MAG TPA: HlyD family efflux transporter periplasmic adaptor subunit [Candidatus Acidoferrales bacterium]|nr:HlyD family efflux transporter periplasmic adaptor subunit [Candidatus Acidoferrales bacterium]
MTERTNGGETIFRAEAVAAIDSIDRLDEAITIVSARSGLALAAIFVLVAITLLWAIFGTIPVTIEGRGVFVAGSGTARITAAADGTIENVDVSVGDSVSPGEAVARERTQDGAVVALRAPRAGVAVEIAARPTLFVHRGDTLASVAPTGSQLRAIVFVPVNTDRHIEPGMPASVVPADVPELSGRAVKAEVASVAPYPASADLIRNALQDDALAAQFSPTVPVREVQLQLLEGPNHNLMWRGVFGGKTPPAGGTPCTALIQVRERHPIEIIFSRSQ